jgi:hypothetical protein
MFRKGQTVAVVSEDFSVVRIVYVGKATRETSTCVDVDGILYKKDSGAQYAKKSTAFRCTKIVPIESADPAMLANHNARDRFGKAKTRLEYALRRNDFDSLPTESLAEANAQIEALLTTIGG